MILISVWRLSKTQSLKSKWIVYHTNTYIHEMSWKRKQNNSYITDQRLFTYMRQRCVYISISSSHIFLMHPLGKSVVVLVSRAKWVEPCGSTYGLKIKREFQKVMKNFHWYKDHKFEKDNENVNQFKIIYNLCYIISFILCY